MRPFWRGVVLGVFVTFMVAASCHPFPCRTGIVGASIYMVCR